MSLNISQHVESARIAGLLEDCIGKLSFLSSLSPTILSTGKDSHSGDEVRRQMEELKDLESRYEALIRAMSAEQGNSGKRSAEIHEALDAQYEQLLGSRPTADASLKIRVAALRGELTATSAALRDGMKQLLRLLKSSPDNASLSHISEERAWMLGLLEGAASELRRDSSFNRLAAALLREEETWELPKRVEAREIEVQREVDELTAELQKEAKAHEETMEGKLKDAKRLQDTLQKQRSENSLAVRFLRKEVAAGVEILGRTLESEASALTSKLKALREASERENEVFETSKAILAEEATSEMEATEKWKKREATEVPLLKEALARALDKRAALMERLTEAQSRYEEELGLMAEKRVRVCACVLQLSKFSVYCCAPSPAFPLLMVSFSIHHTLSTAGFFERTN